MFRRRGEGPPPRDPVSHMPADPLSAPHLYVSDFQPEILPEVFTDHRAMLRGSAVDAVLVLSTVATHHAIGQDCLAAGLHVLVEKPLADKGHHIVNTKRCHHIVNTARSLRTSPTKL